MVTDSPGAYSMDAGWPSSRSLPALMLANDSDTDSDPDPDIARFTPNFAMNSAPIDEIMQC